MLNAEVLTFREFVMNEPLPLSKIQGAILEFLQGRKDIVLFGAQAVNAYVSEPRATQDVDILSNRTAALADELCRELSERFHITVRVREASGGKGLRLYQIRKDGNRHLADIRSQNEFPAVSVIENINVLTPIELILSKIFSYESRRGKPKSGTDWRDLAVLLNRFPDLKTPNGEIARELKARNASEFAMNFWNDLVETDLSIEDEDDDLNF